MKTDRLSKHQLSTRYSISAQQPKGHLNGFLLSYFVDYPTQVIDGHRVPAFGTLEEVEAHLQKILTFTRSLNDTHIRVKYYDVKTAHVLYSNIPLLFILDKNDLDHGSSGYKSLTDIIVSLQNAALSGESDSQKISAYVTALSSFGNKPIISVYCPIGSIDLQTGDTAEIEVVCNSSEDLTSDMSLRIYSVSRDYDAFHVLKLDEDKDLNEVHNQIIETFIFDKNNTTQFDYEVRGENDNFSSDSFGAISIGSLFSNTENMSIERTYSIYKPVEGIPEDVQVKVFETIDSLDSISIINLRVESSKQKYLSQKNTQIMNVQRLVNKASETTVGRETLQVIASEQKTV